VIHLDNCSVHTSRASTDWLEEHGMLHMPHPPALFTRFGPNDFYLFPAVNERLEQIKVTGKDQFFESLQEILRGIDQDELNDVF
jgi:hypothetical protein